MRHHILPAPANAEFADHGQVRALQHLDDFAIGASAGFDACDADHHAVAVHGFFSRFRRQEHIALDAFEGTVGNQEAVAVAVHVHAADGEFAAARGGRVVAGAQLDEIAAGGQSGERGFQLGARFTPGAQLPDKLLKVSTGVRRAGNLFEQRGVGHSSIVQFSEGQYRHDSWPPIRRSSLVFRRSRAALTMKRGRRSRRLRRATRQPAEFFGNFRCNRRGKRYDLEGPPE